MLIAACWVACLHSAAPGGWAQVLVRAPGCGIPGSTVRITGSGWAEPVPVCEYLFKFDNTEFASRQPDGLFGPPDTTTTVPAGAVAGEHDIKVELRLIEGGTLLQCRKVPFKVVAAIKDPWAGGIATSGGGITVNFDPKDVCDVEPCKKIVMIQVKRPLGEKADGTTRPLTHTEQGFRNAAALDSDLTASGYSVDYIHGEADPYYNGDDAADSVQQGFQNGMPKKSIIKDTPGRSDGAYPAGIVKIILEFEVGVFCAEGQSKGQLFGTMTWEWERAKGGTATATSLSSSRSAPSANFTAALNKWNTNHGFTLPTSGTPTTGGQPCN